MTHTWEGGFHESNTSYYAAVGYLCHQWNNVEHFVFSLASETLRFPFKQRAMLFRHLGVMSAMEFIEDYAAANHTVDVQEQLKHAFLYTNNCRINRNIIVHGFPGNDSETGAEMIRTEPDRNRKLGKTLPISIEAVRHVCMECEEGGMLLIRAQFLVIPAEMQEGLKTGKFWPQLEKALFLKPPLPKLLTEIPHTSHTLPTRDEPSPA
jgi:hypothetical protein